MDQKLKWNRWHAALRNSTGSVNLPAYLWCTFILSAYFLRRIWWGFCEFVCEEYVRSESISTFSPVARFVKYWLLRVTLNIFLVSKVLLVWNLAILPQTNTVTFWNYLHGKRIFFYYYYNVWAGIEGGFLGSQMHIYRLQPW